MINLSELGSAFLRTVIKAEGVDIASNFTKGEIVQATVTKSLGSKGAIIRLRGIAMMAETSRTLVAGQSLLVKVDQVKPQFVVSLLLNETPLQEKTAALLRLYLPSAEPIGSVVSALKVALKTLPQSALKGSGLEKVMAEIDSLLKNPGKEGKNIFKVLGFSHEAELLKGRPVDNLKSALLIVRQNMEELMQKNPALHRKSFKVVTDALNNIELRQLINMSEKQDEKSWQFPYWNGEKMATAHLSVSDGKHGGKGGKSGKAGDVTRLTLLLDMSRIGPIRTEMVSKKEMIEGVVYAGSDSAVREIEEGLASLLRPLKKMGYSANFHVKKAPADFLTRRAEEKIPLPVKELLNVRA